MLILAPKVDGYGPSLSIGSHSRNVIESGPVRPAVIIDQALPEMKAVSNRRPGNSHGPGVDRFHACAPVCRSIEARNFGREFARQGGESAPRSACFPSVLGKVLGC